MDETIAIAMYHLSRNYMVPGWDYVQDRLDVALNVRDNIYSRQIHVNVASSQLRRSMQELGIDTNAPVPTLTPTPPPSEVNRDELSTAMTQAESHNEQNYTSDSWTNLQAELEAAKITYNNVYATQAQLDTAADSLLAAINALEPVTSYPPSTGTFSLRAYNNGVIQSQNLADAGLIRIWALLDGELAAVPSSISVTAIDQDGVDAMEHVRINVIWDRQDYANFVDVNFNAPWQRIYFTATVLDQTVELVLVNPGFTITAPEFRLVVFNNGVINQQALANMGVIRIWLQVDGVNSLVAIADMEITAYLPDGTDAMEFIRINEIWNNPGYANFMDVDFNAPWEQIYLTVTAFGQNIELVLVNPA